MINNHARDGNMWEAFELNHPEIVSAGWSIFSAIILIGLFESFLAGIKRFFKNLISFFKLPYFRRLRFRLLRKFAYLARAQERLEEEKQDLLKRYEAADNCTAYTEESHCTYH